MPLSQIGHSDFLTVLGTVTSLARGWESAMPEQQRFIESAGDFTSVRVGDVVVRESFGRQTELTVTRVDNELIHTEGGWTFDRRTG